MAKKLTTNRFPRVFLDSWDSFKYSINNCPKGGNGKILFNWQFNEYSGYGEIDIKNEKLCNKFGNNFLNMTVSRPNDLSIKTNGALYNDQI